MNINKYLLHKQAQLKKVFKWFILVIIEISLNSIYLKKLFKQILCNLSPVKFTHFFKFNLTKYSDYRVFVQQRNRWRSRVR